MAKRIWSDAADSELRQLYRIKFAKELAEYFNTTERAIYVRAHKLGLHKLQQPHIVLTEEQERWLRRNYPHVANEICCSILDIKPSTLSRRVRSMKLRKTEQFMRECHQQAGIKSARLRNSGQG